MRHRPIPPIVGAADRPLLSLPELSAPDRQWVRHQSADRDRARRDPRGHRNPSTFRATTAACSGSSAVRSVRSRCFANTAGPASGSCAATHWMTRPASRRTSTSIRDRRSVGSPSQTGRRRSTSTTTPAGCGPRRACGVSRQSVAPNERDRVGRARPRTPSRTSRCPRAGAAAAGSGSLGTPFRSRQR